MLTNQQRKNNIKKVAKLAFYFICLTLFCLCSTIKMECPFLQNLFTNVLTILLFSFVSPEKKFVYLLALLLAFVLCSYFLLFMIVTLYFTSANTYSWSYKLKYFLFHFGLLFVCAPVIRTRKTLQREKGRENKLN